MPSERNSHETPAAGRSGSPDAANRGALRPPIIYLAAILIGLGLDFVFPLRWMPARAAAWVGVTLVLISIALFLGATRRFKAAGTPVPGNLPTTTIVQSGPYRFTRNPIYLAFSLFALGVACWVNSIWLLVTLAAAVSVMNFVVIRREERYLERRFGAEYVGYKAHVRRWF
jgi:protein-S-isoprenylcysteine O-methyltransferase Ste14